MATIGLPNTRRTTFGTDYSDLLCTSSSKKTESESTADVRTDYNKWSRNIMLLRIDAYRKYEPLRMLNLLTVLSVRLIARVPTVLTVPVLELKLVFERTLRYFTHYCSKCQGQWSNSQVGGGVERTSEYMNYEGTVCLQKYRLHSKLGCPASPQPLYPHGPQ